MFARCWWLESNSILEPELEKALDDAVQGEPKHLIVNLKGHIRYGPDRGEGSLRLPGGLAGFILSGTAPIYLALFFPW